MSGSKSQRGAAALEFALVLPLLLGLLLAIAEFGYAFFVQAAVSGAARQGVRDYAIHWEAAGAQGAAIALATAAAPEPARVVSASFSATCSAGAQTTLILTYQRGSLTGWFDGLLNPMTTGKGSMQCGG